MTKSWIAISMLAASFPGAANAQTQCMPNNPSYPAAGMTCYNNAPPAIPLPHQSQPSGGGGDVSSIYGICITNRCVRLKQAQAAHVQEVRDVAALLSKGDCDGAIKRALADSDFDTAQKAKNLCAPSAQVVPKQ